MGRINAAIEVGKHKLDVVLGSEGELLSLENTSGAITRLAKQLVELGCERVLIEGGSYQNVLVAALRAVQLPGGHSQSSSVREFAKSIGSIGEN